MVRRAEVLRCQDGCGAGRGRVEQINPIVQTRLTDRKRPRCVCPVCRQMRVLRLGLVHTGCAVRGGRCLRQGPWAGTRTDGNGEFEQTVRSLETRTQT